MPPAPAIAPTRFCPRCGDFPTDERLLFCKNDGLRLDEVDHAHDTGGALTGRVLADKFILKRQLGAGGMGAVYLAVQKPMGREVAVKTLYPHLTHEPKMVERALREAEAANQVDHPNVVTIYDSGRTRDGQVYIAMEYLRGEDLTQLLQREGPLPSERALRIWLPAVRAMATAHHKGVIHRDLKPDNLFIARKRNEAGEEEQVVKIVDFGIAKLCLSQAQGTASGGLIGTLRYMSPEQLQGLEIGPQSDVYALGLVLVQMLTGKLPWPLAALPQAPGKREGEGEAALARTELSDRPELTFSTSGASPAEGAAAIDSPFVAAFQRLLSPPMPLRELSPGQHFSPELQRFIDRVLAIDPAQRPADAGELLRQVAGVPELFGETIDVGAEVSQYFVPPSVLLPAPVCPFPGLEAFDEGQARFFCGRDEEVRAALGRLGQTPEGHKRWLQIEGSSGAGKSSLARAGLLPAVRHGQIAGAPPFFGVAVFRPGRDPLTNLALGLSRAFGRQEPAWSAAQPAQIQERLLGSETGLSDLLREAVPPGQAFLLLCDQLEEALMDPDQGSDDRGGLRRFDALLAGALAEEGGPLYLITTIRSDLVGRFQELPRLEAALNEAARFYLRPMGEEGLRQAILEPARVSGLWWDKGLPERIVADAREAEGSLPLLGHVLRALWEQRSGRVLTRASYEQLGGVGGALTRSADGLLESLGPARRDRARRLFLRLVKLGRGGPGPDARQAIPRSEAKKVIGGPDKEAEELLLRLSGAPDPGAPADAPPPPRLLSISGSEGPGPGEGPGEGRVELLHESLLRSWQTLQRWLVEGRKMLERRDDLEATAQVWEATSHPQDGLPTGGLLAYYQGAGLDEGEREGLWAMASERARRFLLSAQERERRIERERRRRVQRAVVGLSAGVLVMAGMAGFAFVQRSRAERQQTTAEARLYNALEGANRVIGVIDHELKPIAGATEVRRDLLEAVSVLLDHLLSGARDDARVLRSRLISYQQRGDLAQTHEDTLQALGDYQAAVRIAQQLVRKAPLDPQHRLDLALSYRRVGDLTFGAGKLDETQAAFQKDLELTRALSETQPENPRYRLELGRILQRMGNVAARAGRRKEAEADYEQSRALIQSLRDKDQRNPEYQYELAAVQERLGDMLTREGQLKEARQALKQSLGLTEALLQAEPRNEEYHRMLGSAYTRLGNLMLDAGSLSEAQAAYEKSMQTYRLLLDADPRSVAHRQSLASAYRAMGDVAQKMGQLTEARQAYLSCLKLRRALAEADPQNAAYRQGISTVYGSLGDLLQTAGQFAEARASYEESLKLKRASVEADPRNTYNRQRLGAGYVAMGDLLQKTGKPAEAQASYRQALGLIKDLLSSDSQNTRYRQQLGTIYSKLGEVAAGLGQLAEARAAHEEALKLHRALALAYGQNASYRQDLAMSYTRLGETARKAGDLTEARAAYREALRLRQALAEADPQNAEWQRDLLMAHVDLLRLLQSSRSARRPHLSAARAILKELSRAGLLIGDQQLRDARAALGELR